MWSAAIVDSAQNQDISEARVVLRADRVLPRVEGQDSVFAEDY